MKAPCFLFLAAILHSTLALAAANLLVSSDNEGHVGPCQSCPMHAGQGGLARRATVVNQNRASGDVLLLDAGNFLFGSDSLASKGQIIVVGYNALDYDAANISYRDFRLGKEQTLGLLKQAHFVPISANILDAASGKPLLQPYVVKRVGAVRIAVIGLCESPAGLDYLPRLQKQLAGVRFQPPDEALAACLPKAAKESDRVLVLYYGSSTGLAKVRAACNESVVAIAVGGLESEPPADGTPPILTAEQHGKSIARLTLGGATPAAVEQVPVTADINADPAMQRLLANYGPEFASASAPSVSAGPVQSATGTSAPPPMPARGSGSPSLIAPSTAPVPPASPQPDGVKRITAHQAMQPRGLGGVGLTADQVNLAIDRGAAFLWNRIKTEDLGKEKQRLGDAPEHVLACLALVHAGATKKFPDFDQELRGFLTRVNPESYWIVYRYGLMSMLIESYGDPSFFDKQRVLARYLVEAEGPGGTWNYIAGLSGQPKGEADSQEPLRVLNGWIAAAAAPGEGGMSRQSDWSIGKDGDSSCSQFAVLGLHAASRCHLAIAREVWKRNLAAYRRRQGKAGGWGYTDGDAEFPYGSMTCAGLCALAIDRYELGEADFEVDEGIERGLAWLAGHFSVTANPQHFAYYFYYLYSLERIGRLLDTEFIGDHEWYPLGAKALVDSQQPDGSWIEGAHADPRIPTSFALLFLTRATPSLRVELKHGGSGEVTTAVATPPPARLYVILDASGSMLDDMDGRQKFDIARDSVATMFAGLPDSAEVALRVYGHRKQSIEKGSDEDTALEYPMAKIDRPKLKALLQRLRPRGKTPLALSLQQARQDLSSWSGQPVTVVLLTDGGEDTMPRRDPVKAAAEFATLPGLTFHIVGFDINQEDWGTQLRAMAAASGGNYWPAARAEVLGREVRSAVFGIPDQFTLFDSASHEIARGEFGQARTVPEGQYQLEARYGGRDFHTALSVHTEATTAVVFDATHAMAAPSTPATAPTSGPVAAQRFCTHCGHPLPVGAKFCPTCGQPALH